MSQEVKKENAVEKKLFVERRKFGTNSDGKDLFSYEIKAKIRGREITASLVPPDNGGYEVLEIVYLGINKAEIRKEVTEVDGKSYDSYIVFSKDENGEEYACKMKPQRASDKSLLEILMRDVK